MVDILWYHKKEQHGYTKTLQEYKSEKIQERKSEECDSTRHLTELDQAHMRFGLFKRCDYESISKISEFLLIQWLTFSALDRNEDVPEQTFTNFYISEYLKSFDSETDYIGLMISSVKYENKWYHDGRKHETIRKGFTSMTLKPFQLDLHVSRGFLILRL